MADDSLSPENSQRGRGVPPGQRRAQPNPSPRARVSSMGERRPLTPVTHVLNEIVQQLGLDKRLKERALLDLWPTVCGDVFAERSRPLFIDHEGNVVISVKDASVGQELSLHKTELLQKFRPLCRTLSVNIKGMRFDLKHFHNNQAQEPGDTTGPQAAPPPVATDQELAQITLTASDASQIESLRSSLEARSTADVETNNRMVSLYEQELRMKVWRRQQGFPLCPECGEAAEGLHGPKRLCRDCYFWSLSHARDI